MSPLAIYDMLAQNVGILRQWGFLHIAPKTIIPGFVVE
jgi:hypothetical protein